MTNHDNHIISTDNDTADYVTLVSGDGEKEVVNVSSAGIMNCSFVAVQVIFSGIVVVVTLLAS